MTDEKGKVSDKASEIAKHIWLAGVGAYGRAVDEAQGRLEKAGVEPPKLFKDLVKAGAALEDEARDAGQHARQSVEDRITRVRDNFNLQRPLRGEDLLALHEKIDRLSNKVDALADALEAVNSVEKTTQKKAAKSKAPQSKAPEKKPPAKKAPKKSVAARKKSPARSTAARKKAPTGNKAPARKSSG